MNDVKLLTADGAYLVTVTIPFSVSKLDGIAWNHRHFFLNQDGTYREGLLLSGHTKIEPAPALPSGPQTRVTLSGLPPVDGYDGPAPAPIDPKTGMHGDYWVLASEDRAKGFVRPIRTTYKHEKCGTNTVMSRQIAETYARDPRFYTATYCATCLAHFPVGVSGEFVWPDGSKVGT